MLLVKKDDSVDSVFFFNVVVDAAPYVIRSIDLNIMILPSQQLETVILASHNDN